MKSKLIEHLLSILVLTSVFITLILVVRANEATRITEKSAALTPYLQIDSVDLGNPLDAALLKETLNIFHPDTPGRNDSLVEAIQRFRQEQFTNRAYKTGGRERGLSGAKLSALGGMYIQFILMYVIVMVFTYHAAQNLAIFRFVRMKQNRTSYFAEAYQRMRTVPAVQRDVSFFLRTAVLAGKALLKGAAYAVLFAPAYVIAYSIKSTVDTDSFLFMIILGVLSNGLLINYANKFFTFLVTESHKGYVETAMVKNLSSSYAWATPDGIPYQSVLHPKSLIPSHVFRHIYLNARYQFLTTLKEHASFLITGLIIIEMALNVQGHLGYELMQNILYKQYDVVLSTILGIFLLVKATEIVVDSWYHVESSRYDNKG